MISSQLSQQKCPDSLFQMEERKWGGGREGGLQDYTCKKIETIKTWECGFLPSTSSEHSGKGVSIRNLIPTDVRLLNTS